MQAKERKASMVNTLPVMEDGVSIVNVSTILAAIVSCWTT